eukprot:2966482-Lingulodinium_polyedra.AAC.1
MSMFPGICALPWRFGIGNALSRGLAVRFVPSRLPFRRVGARGPLRSGGAFAMGAGRCCQRHA